MVLGNVAMVSRAAGHGPARPGSTGERSIEQGNRQQA
jgi:hypothetical protein